MGVGPNPAFKKATILGPHCGTGWMGLFGGAV
jgi:hypothetical protein